MPRWLTFLIFFTVFMTVYGSLNFYVARRGWQALPDSAPARRLYVVLFVFCSTAFILSRFLEGLGETVLTRLLTWIGSVWLGVIVYLFLLTLIIDLVRLADRLFRFFPASWAADPLRVRQVTVLSVLAVVLLVNIVGYVNGLRLRTRTIQLAVAGPANTPVPVTEPAAGENPGPATDPGPKTASAGDETRASAEPSTPADSSTHDAVSGPLRIVMASDLHLGTVMGVGRLSRIVDAINAQDADLVLLAGDIVDQGMHPEACMDMCGIMRRIRARHGVYACTGNHEFIVGLDRSLPFIEKCGVTMLRDEWVEVAGRIVLAARDDVSGRNFDNVRRKPLADVLAGADRRLPVILMDHTPSSLGDAAAAGVALQLSGHTHNGQLWPINHITGMIFEQDYGYLKKGGTHYYVSCGAGVWGPPVRTNSTCEVAVILLTFR